MSELESYLHNRAKQSEKDYEKDVPVWVVEACQDYINSLMTTKYKPRQRSKGKHRKTAKEISDGIRTIGALYTVGHVHAGSSDTNCNASFWVAFEGGVRPIQYNVSSVRKGNMIKKELLPYVTHK